MKNIQKLLSVVLCGLVLTATAAFAQDIKQGVATVVRVKGGASYTLGGGDNWHPLVAGKLLSAGATIRTAPDAIVDVVLGRSVAMPQAKGAPDKISPAPDSNVRGLVSYQPAVEQNVIRLSSDTTLKIDTLTISETGADSVSDTELDLQKGRLFYSVKKLSSESKYLIKIPNGIAGVRGSQGFISADGKCGSILHPLWLSLIGPDGKPVTIKVEEGQQFDPGTGNVGPLSPVIIDLLRQIALSARNCYYMNSSFSDDHHGWQKDTMSPTTGRRP